MAGPLAQLFFDPLIEPPDSLRRLCLLLLVTLVTVMLYSGHQPGIQAVLLHPPWDKVAHMVVYGCFAGLAWVASGARQRLLALAAVLVIGLMDEAMQYYTPGRTADVMDLVADLAGGALALALLVRLRRWRVARLARAASAA